MRYLFRDVFLTPDETGVTVQNRRLFQTLTGYDVRWTLECDRKPISAGETLLPDIAPGESVHIDLPFGTLPEGQTVVTSFLVLREKTGILEAGTVLSHGQTVFGAMKKAETPDNAPAPVIGDCNVGFRGEGLGVLLQRYKANGPGDDAFQAGYTADEPQQQRPMGRNMARGMA